MLRVLSQHTSIIAPNQTQITFLVGRGAMWVTTQVPERFLYRLNGFGAEAIALPFLVSRLPEHGAVPALDVDRSRSMYLDPVC
jgi:hypothetical protein